MVVHVVVVAAGVEGGAANGTKSPVGHKTLIWLKSREKAVTGNQHMGN